MHPPLADACHHAVVMRQISLTLRTCRMTDPENYRARVLRHGHGVGADSGRFCRAHTPAISTYTPSTRDHPKGTSTAGNADSPPRLCQRSTDRRRDGETTRIVSITWSRSTRGSPSPHSAMRAALIGLPAYCAAFDAWRLHESADGTMARASTGSLCCPGRSCLKGSSLGVA